MVWNKLCWNANNAVRLFPKFELPNSGWRSSVSAVDPLVFTTFEWKCHILTKLIECNGYETQQSSLLYDFVCFNSLTQLFFTNDWGTSQWKCFGQVTHSYCLRAKQKTEHGCGWYGPSKSLHLCFLDPLPSFNYDSHDHIELSDEIFHYNFLMDLIK